MSVPAYAKTQGWTTEAMHAAFQVRPMVREDIQGVTDLWVSSFTTREPLMAHLGAPAFDAFSAFAEEKAAGMWQTGLTLVTVERHTSGSIVAFVTCEDLASARSEDLTKVPPELTPIFGLLKALSSDWSAQNTPKHGEMLHVVAGGTSSKAEGKGLGLGMSKELIKLAQRRNFTSLLIEATAGGSRHICEKLGATQVGVLKYADFVDANGSRPFATLTEPMGATLLHYRFPPPQE